MNDVRRSGAFNGDLQRARARSTASTESASEEEVRIMSFELALYLVWDICFCISDITRVRRTHNALLAWQTLIRPLETSPMLT